MKANSLKITIQIQITKCTINAGKHEVVVGGESTELGKQGHKTSSAQVRPGHPQSPCRW